MRTLTPEKEKEINMAVSRWLKSQGISQEEAARRLGVGRQTVSNRLSSLHFTPRSARKWALVFGLNENFLLTGRGPLCNRQTSYQRMVNETETLHKVVTSQKNTIADLSAQLARYRAMFGPLPDEAVAAATQA